MISLIVNHSTADLGEKIIPISGSKSESNRIWVLKALLKGKFLTIANSSNSQDTQLMQEALKSTKEIIDIHHAGTAMRFLTAYFAVQEGRETIITGSARMKERPIGILVDALRQLGSDIECTENEGFPPLKIIGNKLTKNEVTLSASVSSQYISALMLIGITFEKGLIINLEGDITSYPYLNMTIQMLNRIGIDAKWANKQTIIIQKSDLNNPSNSQETVSEKKVYVESDWSSASYLYSMVALSNEGNALLETYYKDSLQGDRALVEIYRDYFNVETTFILVDDENNSPKIKLSKTNKPLPKRIELNLNNCPDIAQTILVNAVGLKIPFKLTGLHTLKIKETDRLVAMQNELFKIGAITEITEDSIELISFIDLPKKATISTYNDHRMAMAFAPIALKGVELEIENPNVVEKSYPNFWEDLKVLGFTTEK